MTDPTVVRPPMAIAVNPFNMGMVPLMYRTNIKGAMTTPAKAPSAAPQAHAKSVVFQTLIPTRLAPKRFSAQALIDNPKSVLSKNNQMISRTIAAAAIIQRTCTERYAPKMLSALLFVKAGNVWASLPQMSSPKPRRHSEIATVMVITVPTEEFCTGLINNLSMTTPSPETRTMVSMNPIDIGIPKAVRALMVRAPNTKNSPCAKQRTRETL
jgi:hypothetical protein